jgi:hypothetical protein
MGRRHRRALTPRAPLAGALGIGLALTLAVAVGLPGLANATVLLSMTVEELTAQSDLVVIAEVEDQHVAWDDAVQRVRTYTRVRLRDRVAGEGAEAAGDTLLIVQEGGFLEDFGMAVAGNAHLVPGEVAVLFLTRAEDASHYFVFGMEQGKYRVEADEAGAQRVTRAVTVPVVVQEIDGTSLLVERPVAELDGQPLDALLTRIRGAAEVAE